ncbi:MAG: RNA 2',3'-cyclic phosphodiesterase [Patescibacteria group bacterium]
MRTFIAIELPQEIKRKIGEFEESLKKYLPLRFVAPQNLHLTLFFLGEIAESRVSEVIEAVKTGTRDIKPFYLFLGKPEFFTHGLWLEVEGQIEVLRKLYQQIGKELKIRNFEIETRPFSAHITIGRSKRKIQRIKSITSTTGITGRFGVDSVSVFTSELKPEGPVYSKIITINLK